MPAATPFPPGEFLLSQCWKSRSPFFIFHLWKTPQIRPLGIRITSDLHDPGEPVNSNLPTPHWPPPPVVTWNFLWPLPSPIRLSVSVSFSFWVVRVVYEVEDTPAESPLVQVTLRGVARFLPCGRVCAPPPTALFPQISSAPPWSSRMCVIAHFDRVCGLLGRFLFSSYLLFFFFFRGGPTRRFFMCSHYAQIACSVVLVLTKVKLMT